MGCFGSGREFGLIWWPVAIARRPRRAARASTRPRSIQRTQRRDLARTQTPHRCDPHPIDQPNSASNSALSVTAERQTSSGHPRPCHQRDRPTGRTSPSSSTATCRVEMPSPTTQTTRTRNSASIPTVPGSPRSTQNFANQMIALFADVNVSGPINSYPVRGEEAR
jgi:hypothetical protein